MGRTLSLSFPVKRLCLASLLTVGIIAQRMEGQDRGVSVTGSGGYGIFNLAAVDAKNAADVAGWSALGVPLSNFVSVKQSPFFSGRVTYRTTREFAVSLYASTFSKSASASYRGSDTQLQLDRSVGATDITVGIAYYPAAQPYGFQWYLQTNLGVILARASANAYGEQASKQGAVTVMVPLVNSEANYRKTKTCAAFCLGADVPLSSGVFLKGEGGYRVAQVGQLNADTVDFGVPGTQISTTIFDYSGLVVSLGVGIDF